MGKQKILKPGHITPKTGPYDVVGPRGGDLGKKVISTAGQPLPPTEKPGQHYVPVDPVKRKK